MTNVIRPLQLDERKSCCSRYFFQNMSIAQILFYSVFVIKFKLYTHCTLVQQEIEVILINKTRVSPATTGDD